MKKKFGSGFKIAVLSLASFLLGAFLVNTEKPQLTKEIVSQAEQVIGLEFTDAERDSMLDNLNELINNYQNLRNIELNNNVMPALLFNPIPSGKKLPDGNSSFKLSDYSNTVLPENKNDLAFYSIGQLAELIRTKQISSVELTKFFIERLKKFDPVLHCVITLTEKRALEQAQKADEEIAKGIYRSVLHGIPYGVKDLLSTKDYKTTWGANPYKNQLINEDAEVIKKLDKAGAVLVAKLSMGALAWGDVWFGGKTRNPWDTTKGSSGSSAGPASAVSAGLLPFSIGTETWGSIVSPSTVCGVTGLRPSYGRVSRTGAMALSWSMDKIGPIARTVEDCAIVFNFISGSDGIDQSVYDLPFNYSPEINFKKLKIGYLKSDFNSHQYQFKANDSLALLKLKQLGAHLIPIELPKEFDVNDISFILSTEAAAAFEELTRSGRDDSLVRQIKNAWPNVFRAHRFVPAVEYINANRARTKLIQQMEEKLKDVDFYMAPSWQGDNLLLTNLTGHPCVVVPTGFLKNGLPSSITFIGKLFDEGTILSAAKIYQDATGFHKIHPKIFIE